VIKIIFRWIMAAAYIVAGSMHFIAPGFYRPLMPPYLPWPLALIYISGAAEVAGGVGVLLPPFRRLAGWGLIALLLAILPANLHAALHGFRELPAVFLWVRLPLQFLLIAWAWWTCLQRSGGSLSSPDRPADDIAETKSSLSK